MNNKEMLLAYLDKVHSTQMGIDRIKRNLNLDTDDVVEWCKNKIQDSNCTITKKGKNYYATIDDCILTINSYSYTIITAHIIKNK